MKALLFIGGRGPAPAKIPYYTTGEIFSIAADSGLELALRLGVRPQKVLGDMDSLSDKALLADYKNEDVLVFPEDKDETDTELGFNFLLKEGYDHIVILGGGGGRMDHFLGILALFDRTPRPKEWFTHSTYVASIDGDFTYDGRKGKQISFFPSGKDNCTMHSKGLRWPLDGLVWSKGNIGVSNEMVADEFSIQMLTGSLLMVTEL